MWDTAPIWEGATIMPYTQGQMIAEKIFLSDTVEYQKNSVITKHDDGLGSVQEGLSEIRQGQFAAPSVAGGTI